MMGKYDTILKKSIQTHEIEDLGYADNVKIILSLALFEASKEKHIFNSLTKRTKLELRPIYFDDSGHRMAIEYDLTRESKRNEYNTHANGKVFRRTDGSAYVNISKFMRTFNRNTKPDSFDLDKSKHEIIYRMLDTLEASLRPRIGKPLG